jgi:hypothetical protein
MIAIEVVQRGNDLSLMERFGCGWSMCRGKEWWMTRGGGF